MGGPARYRDLLNCIWIDFYCSLILSIDLYGCWRRFIHLKVVSRSVTNYLTVWLSLKSGLRQAGIQYGLIVMKLAIYIV